MAVRARYSEVFNPSTACRPMAVCHTYPLSRLSGSDSLIYSLKGSFSQLRPPYPIISFMGIFLLLSPLVFPFSLRHTTGMYSPFLMHKRNIHIFCCPLISETKLFLHTL